MANPPFFLLLPKDDQNRFKLHKEVALNDLYSGEINVPNFNPVALTALSDYVNASVIPPVPPHQQTLPVDEKGPLVYIAAQAPKQHAVGLFWQAVWDSDVKIIVMLTR